MNEPGNWESERRFLGVSCFCQNDQALMRLMLASLHSDLRMQNYTPLCFTSEKILLAIKAKMH